MQEKAFVFKYAMIKNAHYQPPTSLGHHNNIKEKDPKSSIHHSPSPAISIQSSSSLSTLVVDYASAHDLDQE